MSAKERPYYEPESAGAFDIATSSTGKTFVFTADADFSPNAEIVFSLREREVKRYAVGSGVTITNANRTLTLTLDGSDFLDLDGEKLKANCSLFVDGDIEVVFDFYIVKSVL